MRIEPRSLRSKVARRIFLLFTLCALLPMAAVTGVALVAAVLDAEPAARRFPPDFGERFEGLALVDVEAAPEALVGRSFDIPPLTSEEWRHLESGQSVVTTAIRGNGPLVLMSLGLGDREGQRLVGAIRPEYLWGTEGRSDHTALCVFDEKQRIIVPSAAGCDTLDAGVRARLDRPRDTVKWRAESVSYLSGSWLLFMKPRFQVSAWAIVLTEPIDAVQGPIATFRRSFAWTTLASLSTVVLLSLIQIRRSLGPLDALHEGTRRISARDVSARVTVTTNDEFKDLAESFNTMAARLGKQFDSLSTISEIDKAVLSKLNPGDVLGTALDRLSDLVPCDDLAIARLREGSHAEIRLRSTRDRAAALVQSVALRTADLEGLRAAAGFLLEDSSARTPGYLVPLAARGSVSYLTLPLTSGDTLVGFVCFGHRTMRRFEDEDVQRLRQVCDQVAVALTNALLVEELDRLNRGALLALARAIDAKSPWTAGHSERVTELALKIGRRARLSPRELGTLRRGGLLHDVGKIGVDGSLLDKPDRLNDEEMAAMRDHVRIGASILEPLTAFADALPIVTEHHEWFNGGGYPRGLKGEEISLGGRIFAVADVFDALTSSRPYRRGMSRAQAAETIKRDSGRQFDPAVVQIFLDVLADEPNPVTKEGTALAGPGPHALRAHAPASDAGLDFSGTGVTVAQASWPRTHSISRQT